MSFLTRIWKAWHREILGLGMLLISVTLFLALVTDGYQGDAHRPITEMASVPNGLSVPGAVIAGLLYMLLGQASHVLYLLTGLWSLMLLRGRPFNRIPTRLVGLLLLTTAVAGILHVDLASAQFGDLPGGALGSFAGKLGLRYFGAAGANVVAATLGIMGILLATEFMFIRLFVILWQGALMTARAGAGLIHLVKKRKAAPRPLRKAERRPATLSERFGPIALSREPREAGVASEEPSARTRDDLKRIRIRPEPGSVPVESEKSPEEPILVLDSQQTEAAASPNGGRDGARPSMDAAAAQLELLRAEEAPPPAWKAPPSAAKKPLMPRRKTVPQEELPPDYVYPKRYTKPPLDLLEPPDQRDLPDLGDRLREISGLLQETLQTFGIEARVTDVTRGPTITRYELEPAPGVKVSRFQALADDLALALKAYRVRVEAPIPGKGRVGIEVPNEVREPVVLRELLESKTFRKSTGRLTLALGKDIAGDVSVTDLTTMPHLLVAGATGAGKTVCVKTLLASLLFTKTPEELQLMLIDPKMVELSIFNEIPHLITPVVTDPKKAATSLNWLIVEMEERYRLFAHLRVRNIEVYNESVENGEIEMPETPERGAETMDVIRKLPYIVCVIDELADLMILARAEVEDAIARLAQLARAVGIHVVIATQRPSVDVLTGVIKANFPARISFQVSSRVDSRCILDEIGAEQLIGKGDMLYLPAGQSKPTRIQSAFVSDAEMNALIAYLKSQAPPQYRDEIANFGKAKDQTEDLANETDDLLDDAVRVVLETGQASISMVQRRLRVGYTRAARLIDMMELKGIVGPHTGSKAREILVELPRKNDEVA